MCVNIFTRVCHTCPEAMMSLFWVRRETHWTCVSVNLKHTCVAVNMSCQVNTLCYVNFVITGKWLQLCVKCQVGWNSLTKKGELFTQKKLFFFPEVLGFLQSTICRNNNSETVLHEIYVYLAYCCWTYHLSWVYWIGTANLFFPIICRWDVLRISMVKCSLVGCS
jgi:hypothetical protein